jgi:hypothetical protein
MPDEKPGAKRPEGSAFRSFMYVIERNRLRIIAPVFAF